jgi:hypothetical protein
MASLSDNNFISIKNLGSLTHISAISFMYLIFLKERPNSLKSLSAILINFLGVIDLIFFIILLSIEAAASIDIC